MSFLSSQKGRGALMGRLPLSPEAKGALEDFLVLSEGRSIVGDFLSLPEGRNVLKAFMSSPKGE